MLDALARIGTVVVVHHTGTNSLPFVYLLGLVVERDGNHGFLRDEANIEK